MSCPDCDEKDKTIREQAMTISRFETYIAQMCDSVDLMRAKYEAGHGQVADFDARKEQIVRQRRLKIHRVK